MNVRMFQQSVPAQAGHNERDLTRIVSNKLFENSQRRPPINNYLYARTGRDNLLVFYNQIFYRRPWRADILRP